MCLGFYDEIVFIVQYHILVYIILCVHARKDYDAIDIGRPTTSRSLSDATMIEAGFKKGVRKIF